MKKAMLEEIRKELRQGKKIYDYNLRVVYYDRPIFNEESSKLQLEEFIKNKDNWNFICDYCEEKDSTRVFEKMIQDSKEDKFDIVIVRSVYNLPIYQLADKEYYCMNNMTYRYIVELAKTYRPEARYVKNLVNRQCEWKLLLFETKVNEKCKGWFERVSS